MELTKDIQFCEYWGDILYPPPTQKHNFNTIKYQGMIFGKYSCFIIISILGKNGDYKNGFFWYLPQKLIWLLFNLAAKKDRIWQNNWETSDTFRYHNIIFQSYTTVSLTDTAAGMLIKAKNSIKIFDRVVYIVLSL